MTNEKINSLFLLAGLEVQKKWALQGRKAFAWLVRTQLGDILIEGTGESIDIDWSEARNPDAFNPHGPVMAALSNRYVSSNYGIGDTLSALTEMRVALSSPTKVDIKTLDTYKAIAFAMNWFVGHLEDTRFAGQAMNFRNEATDPKVIEDAYRAFAGDVDGEIA